MKNQKQISVNRSRRCALLSPTTPLHVITYIFLLLLLLLLPRVPPATAQPSNQRPPYGGVNPNFKPSMAVTITVLAAAFVFIALFSLYIRRCSRDTHMTTNGTLRGIAGRSRRAPRGLNPTVIETFPTFAYSEVKGLKIGKGTLECAVCLNEFEDDETLRLLPKCDHVFHPQCIDAWLSSHTTCPVCRADLESVSESEPVEKTGQESAEVPGGIGSAAETRSPEVEIDESQEQVLIRVNDDSTKDSSSSQPDVINPSQIPSQNRPVRSKSTRARIGEILKFPRSHSTGHSLVQPGENFDRFTLRLPEEVRKQILSGKLNRSTSCVTFVTRQGSVSGSRHGYRSGSDGGKKDSLFGRFDRSGKSDRWGFSMAPPFFWRNPSVRASKKGGDGSVKSPFDCMGAAKTDESEQSSSARPPV